MTSPFPGMDPYLEGAKWPDVHHKLTSVISELITPRISPKYVVNVETYVIDDTNPTPELGIMYPDVAVLRSETGKGKEEEFNKPDTETDVITPASVTIPTIISIPVRVPYLEIRDQDNNVLITTIEILSPVNKRNPGLEPYRKKRQELYRAGVHFLEIDLLRRGDRPVTHPMIPEKHYYVALARAKGKTQVWSFDVRERLPVVPVPLKDPDADVPLDLGKALQIVYQRSYYGNAIDYSKDPPLPLFSEEDRRWIRKLLRS